MAFRFKQKYKPAFGKDCFEAEEHELPSGEIQTILENQSEKTMPEPELFDLKNQLEAGIDLEEVNSKIMSSKSVNAEKVIRKYTKKSTKSTEE